MAVGALAGPAGSVFGTIAGAALGALFGAAFGCEVGAALGEVVDRNILENCCCSDCGHTFSEKRP